MRNLKYVTPTKTFTVDEPPPLPGIPGCYLASANKAEVVLPFVIVLLNDTSEYPPSGKYAPLDLNGVHISDNGVHIMAGNQKLPTFKESIDCDFIPRRNHILRAVMQ